MTFEIAVSNNQSTMTIPTENLEKVLCRILTDEGATTAEISLVIVDNPTIHKLNVQYLNHDYPTDVLSFPLEDDDFTYSDAGSSSDFNSDENETQQGETPQITPQTSLKKRIEGEIIVSAEMAIERASEFHWNAEEELLLYVVHGMLHLCGYADKTEDECREMRKREAEVLADWGIQIPQR